MKDKYKDWVAVVGIAVTTAILFNALFFVSIKLPWDAYYHLSRVANLRQGWNAFLYPQNFTTLGQYGLSTNIFYPALTLQVVQNFIFHTSSVLQAFKISMILTTCVSGVSVYIILRRQSTLKRRIIFLFSVFWLSTIGVTALASGNLAESVAYIGIPWLSYGLYLVTADAKNNLRKIVINIAVGLSIAAYSHIMTFFILSIITAVYLLILFFKTKNKITIFKIILFGGLTTFISTAAALIPIIVIQVLNVVKKPVVSAGGFAYNVKDISQLLLNPSDSPDTWLPLFIVIICIITSVRKPKLGVVLGLITMLVGTNFVPWTYYLQHSPITFIQFATRFIKPSIAFALMFTLLDIESIRKNIKNSSITYRALMMYVLLTFTVMTGVIRNNWFSNGNSQLWTINQLKEYTTTYDDSHDGYGYPGDMTFGHGISNNQRFWYLKNYTDYIPKDALSNPNSVSTFIGSDKLGLLLTKHQIIDSNGKIYNTNSYKTTLKSITMYSSQTIAKNTIVELPVVGYKGLRVDVAINNKKQHYTIKNGKISVKLVHSLRNEDRIKIKQYIPLWILLLNVISITTLIVLIMSNKKN
ncbi:hypothetical protein GCM10025879_18080 [Leuconostoc litchii]|uniref:Membrane protein 6-pyruvoyl-tetrahydropterin synthase-related domain-containing protein n=1 Tax=Leuconostoc litchii TaxID=1981069 RepID=A0A6P2CQS5_9LACO|nr:hypothetical protein [Leuconostoc litchii]TYC46687.1 hypothetical protein ESZ47_00690 [Leuconostoc litchii]GMA70562.1 hypothetical protein GCM10025879_18080 [Leuconostoc litchii]